MSVHLKMMIFRYKNVAYEPSTPHKSQIKLCSLSINKSPLGPFSITITCLSILALLIPNPVILAPILHLPCLILVLVVTMIANILISTAQILAKPCDLWPK